jgi:hypothetical protein
VHGTRSTRRVLAPSEAASKLVAARKAGKDLTTAKVGDLRQQISAYAAKQQKRRPVVSNHGPTPERLAKGDLGIRPLHGPDGFISSVNYDRKRIDVVGRFAKSWAPEVQKAFEQFAIDAHVGDVKHITIDYARAGQGGSRSTLVNKVGGVGESHRKRMAMHRHEALVQALRDHFDGVPNVVPVVDVLEFLLCQVESERLRRKGQMPQSIADVGSLIVGGYKDPTSNTFVTRGALEMVGRFMASFYLRHWATYGALYRADDVVA